MKKRIAVMAAACALALALPTLAWAADSPQTKTGSATSGSATATFTYTGTVTVTTATGEPTGMTANEKNVGGFAVKGDGTIYTLTLATSSEYANCHYRILSETVAPAAYQSGTGTATVASYNPNAATLSRTADAAWSGYLDSGASVTISNIEVSGTQNYYLVVDPTDKASTDSSSVSPKTGVNPYLYAGIAGVALVAAAGVTMVIRRKEVE